MYKECLSGRFISYANLSLFSEFDRVESGAPLGLESEGSTFFRFVGKARLPPRSKLHPQCLEHPFSLRSNTVDLIQAKNILRILEITQPLNPYSRAKALHRVSLPLANQTEAIPGPS
jgi:hypothetical protein